jgi:hypothetical protein
MWPIPRQKLVPVTLVAAAVAVNLKAFLLLVAVFATICAVSVPPPALF